MKRGKIRSKYGEFIELLSRGEDLRSIAKALKLPYMAIEEMLADANTPQRVVEGANKQLMLNFGAIMKTLIIEATEGQPQAVKVIFDYMKNLDIKQVDKEVFIQWKSK